MKRLKVAYDEALETVGAKLLPVLASLGEWFLNKGMPAMSQMWDMVQAKLVPAFQTLSAFAQDTLLPALKQVGDWFMADMLPVLQNVAGFIMDKVVPAVMAMWEWVATKLLPAGEELIGKVLDGLTAAFGYVSDAMERNKPALESVVNGLKALGGFLVEKIFPVLGSFAEVALPAVGKALGIVIDIAGALITAFVGIKDGISAAVGAVKDGFGKIKDFVGGLIDAIAGFAKDIFGAGAKLGSSIVEGIMSGIRKAGGFVSDLAASIKSAINNALRLPVTITPPVWFPGDLAFTVPAFARGTTYAPGGTALVGERGPELVRLNRGAQVIPNDRLMGMGGGSVTINFNGLVTDPKAAAREIQRILLQQKRTTGAELGLA